MVLKEYLKALNPDEVIYLGCDSENKRKFKCNGSGFIYIGHAKNAPVDEYGDATIMDIYPHETDYYGTTILIQGTVHGSYWIWHECDPKVPVMELGYQQSDEIFENLLISIARLCVQDYRSKLIHEIKRVKPIDMNEVDAVISYCRMTSDLDFLSDSGIGQYLIQAVEDEVRVLYKYPKIPKDYEKRYKFLREKRHEVQRERLKKQEKSKYATIKGKSVNHDVE